ncbi:hypothetical protein K439DRAFT_50743 [Ramaria rubella]|nr:hypothetical protein K439DRAFT_50743 [Ramaria rubella]
MLISWTQTHSIPCVLSFTLSQRGAMENKFGIPRCTLIVCKVVLLSLSQFATNRPPSSRPFFDLRCQETGPGGYALVTVLSAFGHVFLLRHDDNGTV